MFSNRNKRLVAIAFVSVFLFMALSPALVKAYTVPTDLRQGPYIDKLVEQVITDDDQAVLALQAGTIDMDYSFFEPVHYEALDADPAINIFTALRNGYGHITINTRDAPLNETVLRQAFAFAYDKTRVTSEVMDGWSIEHDSLVPQTMSWCIEDQLPWHYYYDESVKGNQMLNASNLFPFGPDGYRTYKGTPIDIEIAYSSASEAVAGATARIGVDALQALHIHAHSAAANFNEYISRLNSHGDYDMIFFAYEWTTPNIYDFLAYEFWSENANAEQMNYCNFANATYDSCRDQLLHGTTYDDVYNATKYMQLILHEQVPMLIVYENTYNQGYRNDKFTGFVPDSGRYIAGIWTMRHVRELDGTTGGTLTMRLSQEPDSFNFFVTSSAYAHAIYDELWPRLYTRDNNLAPYSDLATSLLTETHDDNPDVPVGHTRFTIDIIQNATWSDGTKLTANDVAFTFTYDFESLAYGNPAGLTLTDLESAVALTPYRVQIEFNTLSYWHFENFAYNFIIPEHIFNDIDGIGYANWNRWNPEFNADDPHVNCGPFTITDMEAGEFYELSYNPTFYYGIPHPVETTTTTTATGPDWTLAIVAGAVGAAVVILVGGFVLLRQK
jgi:ABC-type transport system substrate-binding protein